MKNKVTKLAAGLFLVTALLVGNIHANGTEFNAIKIEIIEIPAQIENWMTNDAIWNTESIDDELFNIEAEAELEIEKWMTRPNIWSNNYQFNAATETAMELENWMTSEGIWNIQPKAMEEKLKLESWMVNTTIWN